MAIYETYKVRRGDTLGGIARAFNSSVQHLCRMNGIANPNRIAVGRVINIRQVSDTFRIGDVGDTLRSVAERVGLDSETVSRANGKIPIDDDIGGKPIVIPSNSPAAGTAPSPGHVLGRLSAKYETSGRGPGTVSSGRGDSGGASYGSYQLASNKDQPRLFLLSEGERFAARFRELTQGTPPFTSAWKKCATEEGATFADCQHAYIKRTHYDVQRKLIAERAGLDTDGRSATLRDVVWSVAVQHGPKSGLISQVISDLAASPKSADFDKQLIDAIYLERGRRDAAGRLVHFSKNSAEVQEGVAARFRSERADAQAMLAAETAKATLTEAVLNAPAAATGEDDDAFLTRIASRMSDSDVNQLMDHYGDDETRADFENGRKVLVALRRQTNWKNAPQGEYDDPMLLVWKSQGKISVRRFKGTTEAAGAYAFGNERAARGSSVDIDRDRRNDMGRLRAGVYHFIAEKHAKLGNIFRARDIQVVDRDCNHDGRFTPNDTTSGDRIDPRGAGTTMYIHKGGTGFTGSAGCQTLPPSDFAALLAALGPQKPLSYVLINAD